MNRTCIQILNETNNTNSSTTGGTGTGTVTTNDTTKANSTNNTNIPNVTTVITTVYTDTASADEPYSFYQIKQNSTNETCTLEIKRFSTRNFTKYYVLPDGTLNKTTSKLFSFNFIFFLE